MKKGIKPNIDYIHHMNQRKLVVLLENCLLKDTTKMGKRFSGASRGELSSCPFLDNHNFLDPLGSGSFINPENSNLHIAETVSHNKDHHEIESVAHTWSLAESLVDLPISNTIGVSEVAKSSTVGDVLCWEKLSKPLLCEVKTPVTSEGSSVVELDLTPPCSVASESCMSEEYGLSSFEDSLVSLDFNTLSDNNEKVDKPFLTDYNKCRELHVEIVSFQPTIRQLQVLYRRKTLGKGTHANYGQISLRPNSNIEKVTPSMLNQSNLAEGLRKRKKITQLPNVLHSTNNSIQVKKNKRKVKDVAKLKAEKRVKHKKQNNVMNQKITNEIKLQKLAEKQKEAFRKKELKHILEQKKKAIKDRNKFENALGSINSRIFNQNSFWKVQERTTWQDEVCASKLALTKIGATPIW